MNNKTKIIITIGLDLFIIFASIFFGIDAKNAIDIDPMPVEYYMSLMLLKGILFAGDAISVSIITAIGIRSLEKSKI